MKFEEKIILSYSRNDVELENATLIKILNQLGYKVIKKYFTADELDYLKIKVFKALQNKSLENKQLNNKEE